MTSIHTRYAEYVVIQMGEYNFSSCFIKLLLRIVYENIGSVLGLFGSCFLKLF